MSGRLENTESRKRVREDDGPLKDDEGYTDPGEEDGSGPLSSGGVFVRLESECPRSWTD